MARIYKPVGPSANKAEGGPTATKTTAPVQGTKKPDDTAKKETGGDK